MTTWRWLYAADPPYGWRFVARVILKAAALFVALNLLCVLLDPLPTLGKLSAYNRLFAGRPRLPYGENPAVAYNLSLFQLDAMFAAHEIARSPRPDEFRVLLIGDSVGVGNSVATGGDARRGSSTRQRCRSPTDDGCAPITWATPPCR